MPEEQRHSPLGLKDIQQMGFSCAGKCATIPSLSESSLTSTWVKWETAGGELQTLIWVILFYSVHSPSIGGEGTARFSSTIQTKNVQWQTKRKPNIERKKLKGKTPFSAVNFVFLTKVFIPTMLDNLQLRWHQTYLFKIFIRVAFF